MKDTRVGVVGTGHLGYHHVRNYLALDDVEFVGAVDLDADRRATVADELKVPTFDSLQGLIDEGVEAVSVVTPTIAHEEVTLQLLAAGVHVMVEKPIASTLEEAERMVAAAKDSERILQVGHIERFNGAVMAISHAVNNPQFIECHRLSPYPGRGHDVSVVLDLMIHDLDIILSMVGSEVVSLDAIGVSVFSEQEDIANVRLRFASGCVANLTSSRISMDRMRKIRIFEENAYVSTDYSEQEVVVYRKKPGALAEGASPMESILIETLDVKREEPLRLELESFVHCVRTRDSPVVSGEHGLRALDVAERILEFIRKNS